MSHLNFSDELLKKNPVFAQRNPNALQKVRGFKTTESKLLNS